jgi:branched-subunit amino acid transport protein
MDSARRLLQFALAPLLIALVAYRSMRGAGQRAWWTHAVLASIPAVLLVWVWVSRRPSF